VASYSTGPVEPASIRGSRSNEAPIPFWMTTLLAAACGLLAANVYYSQPIAGPIALSLGLSPAATGLVVTLTQIGFGAGLLLVVPLADLVENRRLVVILTGVAAVALYSAGLSNRPQLYLVFALLIGLASVAVQILVPYAAHLSAEAARGRVVGNVMSGLMIGILLARPASSFVTQVASWHMVFYVSASCMIVLAATLALALPKRTPVANVSYAALVKSMGYLALRTPVLQRRALYQAFLFGAFSLFWTTVPLLLGGSAFHMSQHGIALFALAGGAGAVAAPIAGRWADKGLTRPATAFGMLAVAAAFLVNRFADAGTNLSLALLVGAAILLDFGMTANLTLGQRAIFALGAEYRSRLNGLYMSTFFVGGALGSPLGGWAYATGGWTLTSWVGFALPVAALLAFLTEGSRTWLASGNVRALKQLTECAGYQSLSQKP
jgi:predicted MFS family arabinose efflux permease